MRSKEELKLLYQEAVLEYITDYIEKHKLMFGRKLQAKIDFRYDSHFNYVYFFEGDKYFMHYQITSFEDWLRIEGKI